MASQRNGGEVEMQDLENNATAPRISFDGIRNFPPIAILSNMATSSWGILRQSPVLPQNAVAGTHDTPLPPDHTASNSRRTPITESSAANNNNNQLPGPSSNRLENDSQSPELRSSGTNNSNDHPKSPAPTTIPESNQTRELPVGSPRSPTRRNTEHTVSGRSSSTNSPSRNPTSPKSPKPNSTSTSSGSQNLGSDPTPLGPGKVNLTPTSFGSQNTGSNPTPNGSRKEMPTRASSRFRKRVSSPNSRSRSKSRRKKRRRQHYIIFSKIALVSLLIALALGLGLGFGLAHHNPSSSPPNPQSYTGSLTYFLPSSSPPFCSTPQSASASQNTNTVAINPDLFSSTTTTGTSLCGAKLRAWRFDTSVPASGAGAGLEENSVELVVMDKCASCAERDISVNVGAFEQLADSELELGRVDVMWEWL